MSLFIIGLVFLLELSVCISLFFYSFLIYILSIFTDIVLVLGKISDKPGLWLVDGTKKTADIISTVLSVFLSNVSISLPDIPPPPEADPIHSAPAAV